MAKVIFSGLVSGISGSLAGSSFKQIHGRTSMIRKPQPKKTRTQTQKQFTLAANYYSGVWSTLPQSTKALWNKYASLSGKYKIGFRAFTALNVSYSMSYDGEHTLIELPPQEVSSVPTITSFSVLPREEGKDFIFLKHPVPDGTRALIFRSISCGYSKKSRHSWKMIQTAKMGSIAEICSYTFDVNLIRSYRIQTIDGYGRRSMFSTILSSPYFTDGYGSAAYGWTCYGIASYGTE